MLSFHKTSLNLLKFLSISAESLKFCQNPPQFTSILIKNQLKKFVVTMFTLHRKILFVHITHMVRQLFFVSLSRFSAMAPLACNTQILVSCRVHTNIVIRIIWLGNYWTMLLIRLCTFNASLNTFKSIVIRHSARWKSF